MKLRDLFESDVTRDIPPVVYFHEQSPEKLAAEVKEYIVTGGWERDHPNHRRVPSGIHEQYVTLLNNITAELGKPGGPELPNAWISGFYGSGKSSFAKLLGMALDGVSLPDGTSLAEAWLRRDTSQRAAELRDAWTKLRQQIDPIAVVFDIGAVARDNEQIHSAVARRVQVRLGYCEKDANVAAFELKLERDGEWARFEKTVVEVLKQPWSVIKNRALVEEDFSAVMHAMFPERYADSMAWVVTRAGTYAGASSPEEAVDAIKDMLRLRAPNATLFIVVDEVSQYVLGSQDRVLRLTSFAERLGAHLKGKAWLLALGQQKLDEDADESFLVRAKDRFPPKLRVHLAATNIRDVVHKRLLAKKPAHEATLRTAFERVRTDLKLFAWGCDGITAEDFVEVYPLLPGHIDLLLQITSALRLRSSRAQGDDQAIRGLLQMLGELFRDQRGSSTSLADAEVGTLITFDRIYDVQHTALDSDAQASMARILAACGDDASGLLVRVAKVVALAELVQDTIATDAKLVAQLLFDKLDHGNNQQEILDALEELRRRNLLGYSEKHGYRLQSSIGEEWESERKNRPVSREAIAEVVQNQLKLLMASPERPRIDGRTFSFEGVFSDGRQVENAVITDSRDDATVRFDFRLLSRDERTDAVWVKRSAEAAFENLLVWVAGDTEDLDARARELVKSGQMVRLYRPRRESLNAGRKLLLQQEENRLEDLERSIKAVVGAAWLAGRVYFRGEVIDPRVFGNSFATALAGVANRKLPDIYSRFVATNVLPSELKQLLEPELVGPSQKFLDGDLGLLELDAGRYVPTCTGVVPRRVLEFINDNSGASGTSLLARFGGPPYGYPADVVKACVVGLLRASKIKISPEVGDDITAIRDAGARDVFDKDRAFKRASFFAVNEDDVGPQARAKICRFFEEHLKHAMDREDQHIADAVQNFFPTLASRTRDLLQRLQQMPGRPQPEALIRLEAAIEQCLRKVRQTQPTVLQVKAHLDALRDGVQFLNLVDAELTPDAVRRVRALNDLLEHQVKQLAGRDLAATTSAAIDALKDHLSRERPWRELVDAEAHGEVIKAAYVAERTRLLARQEDEVAQARSRIKQRDGFATLTNDQSHAVLRPLIVAQTDTSPEAVSPPLSDLGDAFDRHLHRAEDDAIEILDHLQATKTVAPVTVVKVDLGLKNREVGTEQEVELLIKELRDRLLTQLKSGIRVRLM